MKRAYIHILLMFLVSQTLFAQDLEWNRFLHRDQTIYVPLGKISFADSVISYKVGTHSPKKIYQNPRKALGTPDYQDYYTPKFVSLGCQGSLILQFSDNGFMNLAGPDLYIFECGPSREAAKIELSTNGTNWVYGGKVYGGKSTIELSDYQIDSTTIYKYIRITDLQTLCKGDTSGVDIDAVAALNAVVRFTIHTNVLFDIDSATLKPQAFKELDKLIKLLENIPKATLKIEGHTDSDGTLSYNMELATRRANAIELFLKENLKGTYTFLIQSFGEEKPKAPNNSLLNKQLNRRVEVFLLPHKTH